MLLRWWRGHGQDAGNELKSNLHHGHNLGPLIRLARAVKIGLQRTGAAGDF